MKILISDIWSVYNAGDRAILEGLLDGVREMYPSAEVTIAAHFPEGCSGIEGVRVIQDVLAFDEAGYQAQLASVDGLSPRLDVLKEAYRTSDLVISTGGYFLNASPGNAFATVFLSRLLHFQWALDAGVKVAVLGQSLGPIEGAALRAAAAATFARIPLIGARDLPSYSWMLRTGVAPQVCLTADLAVDLAPASAEQVDAAMRRLGLPRGALGISVRHYPGTPKHAFRDVARVADRVVRDFKLPVLLIGTTVPPADAPEVQRRERELGNDDSLALREVHALMREKQGAVVCAESLPPRVLKGVLATCRAFVATRMHAAILASTAGVPVAGLAYEFKVNGWFERLGMGDFVLPLGAVSYDNLWPLTCRLLTETRAIETHLVRAVAHVKEKSRVNYERLAELVPPTGSLPSSMRSLPRGEQPWEELIQPSDDVCPTPEEPAAETAGRAATLGLSEGDPRRAWEAESTHYDVFHRRLQRIVALAEQRGGSRLLDVGCSAGTVGAALAPHWTYHGCDVSETAVRSAKRGWLVPADLEQGIPAFDEQPYDVIVCSGILEYLEDPVRILRSLQGRLAPNGHLIVSYFNMRHVSRRNGQAYRHPLWRNDYSPAEFRALLSAAGWSIVETSWSTAGLGSAPDVRGEAEAVRVEPTDAARRLDEIGHTLIYVARPAVAPAVATPRRMPASVVIPAFNRFDLLRPVLEGFSRQETSTPFEVVVVDDGSTEPISLEGFGPQFRLLRQVNRGRAAAVNAGLDAARGEVVIVCDSDIVPEKRLVSDHLKFHHEHREEGATHLGDLVWGVDAGALGNLLGARANPRLVGHRGAVNWTRWFTDNWSCKRSLLDRHALRFDSAFRKWGWEELEFACRLESVGATNQITGTAVGNHLKPVTIDGLLRCYTGSVGNLLHLARRVGPKREIRDWLVWRSQSAELEVACERVLRLLVTKIEECWQPGLMPAPATALIGADISDAIFRQGIAKGFGELPREQRGDASLPPAAEWELAACLGELFGCALAVGKYFGKPTADVTAAVRDALGKFESGRVQIGVEQRAKARVLQLAKLLNEASTSHVKNGLSVAAVR